MKDEQKSSEIRDQIAATISDSNLSDSLIRDYEAIVKIAVDTAVQRVIDGLSVELDIMRGSIEVIIKFDNKTVASSAISLRHLKHYMDF